MKNRFVYLLGQHDAKIEHLQAELKRLKDAIPQTPWGGGHPHFGLKSITLAASAAATIILTVAKIMALLASLT